VGSVSTLADHIEAYIKRMIRENQGRAIELSRAQLADAFACVPSQINYVLTTRFSLERGYIVESRRGGGGYIRIGRVQVEDVHEDAFDLISQVGSQISEKEMENILARLLDHQIITSRQARIIRGIIQQETARVGQGKALVRASLVRALLLFVLQQQGN